MSLLTGLYLFAALIGFVVIYLLLVATLPGIRAPEIELPERSASRQAQKSTAEVVERADVLLEVDFEVGGDRVAARLHLPERHEGRLACVVMGAGLGGTMDMALPAYAERFVAAGLAVLRFDHRFIGASGGKPRQLVWIPHQLEDWRAAIDFARGRPEIDRERILLWGTSAGGGLAFAIAAEDHRVAGLMAQCPGLDGRAAARAGFERGGLGLGLHLVMHAQRDLVRSWLGLAPHRVAIVGPPGSLALMNVETAWRAFTHMAPPDYDNRVCARIAIRGDKFRPIKRAVDIRCPVLLQLCERDELLPLESGLEAAQLLGELAQVERYPIGHFEIYAGAAFERAVADQVAFCKRVLQLDPG